jgi:hypothetical protein
MGEQNFKVLRSRGTNLVIAWRQRQFTKSKTISVLEDFRFLFKDVLVK